MELTDAQIEFIEKFIIKGFFAKRTDKSKAHNKEVRAAYESFLAQRAQVQALLDTLPADHDSVTRYRAAFGELAGIEQDDTFAGDFMNLLDKTRQLIEDATNFQDALRTMKKKLLADLAAAGSVPMGAKQAETLEIGRMRAQGIALLSAEFPTRASMSDVPALVREMKDIANGIETRASLAREANAKFAALLPAITAIPADHTETAGFEATRVDLIGDLGAADSAEDYSAAITRINLLDSTVDAFKTKLKSDKQELLDKLTEAAKAADGSVEAEAEALSEILNEAQELLAAELPSQANLTSAAAKVVILGVKQGKIGERISKTAFEKALALARAAIDGIPDDHPQAGPLETVYKELDDELKNENHEGSFNAEKLKADNIVVNADAAKLAIKTEKQTILVKLAAAAAAPEGSLPAEEQALTAILADGTALLDADVPSRANLDLAAAKIATATAKAGEIRVRLKLAALNLPQGSGTAAAAEAALKSFESVLKGVPVTKEMKTEAQAAARTASNELSAVLTKKPAASNEEKQAAKQKYLEAKKMADAILGSEMLAENLAPGGALTATSPMKTSDAAKAQFIDGMMRAPGMTGKAMDACKYSKNADAVAAKVGTFAKMVENGVTGNGPGFTYFNPVHSEIHAGNLLANGAHRGEAYLNGAQSYIENGGSLNKEMGLKTGDKWVQLASRRSSEVAGAFLSEGDPYDLNSDAARKALGDMNYGYSSIRPSTPIHAQQIEETLTLLNEEETKEKFRSATKPAGNGATLAVELMKQVHGDSWVPPDPLTPKITQEALMIAMFNPIEQGSVGSCFATAGLITLRKQDPQRALDIYKQALEQGTFTPLKQPDDIVDPLPIPLVLEYTEGDNPITRSIEYTTATAGAALATSNDGTTRDASITKALKDPGLVAELQTLSGGDADEALLDRLQLATELATQITFAWDATAPLAAGGSSDGSSKFGCYVASVGGTKVHDADYEAGKAKFIAAALVIARKVYKDKLKAPEDETKLADAIKSDAFVNSFKSGKTAIWQMHGGGTPSDADRVLLNPKSETTNLPGIPPSNSAQTESERTLDVVTGLMGNFDGSDKNVSLFTRGQHIFNGTQNDPSQDAIRGKSKSEIEAFFTAMGNEVTSLDLPKEQAAGIYDEALAGALKTVPDDLKGAAQTALDTKRPGAAMKSPAVNTAITEGQDAMWTAVIAAATDTHVNTWVATQGTKYDGKSASEKKAAYEAELRKTPPQDSVRKAMAANLPMPDPVVIADTNWGGSGSHTYFVIAPDPATGEPIMWQKDEPPGSMSPAGRDWMDRTWAQTKPKTPVTT